MGKRQYPPDDTSWQLAFRNILRGACHKSWTFRDLMVSGSTVATRRRILLVASSLEKTRELTGFRIARRRMTPFFNVSSLFRERILALLPFKIRGHDSASCATMK